MKLTKKLQKLLDKWQTNLRQTPQVVTHQGSGERAEISPLQFAVYETALKALSTHYFVELRLRDNRHWAIETLVYYHGVAGRNDIHLPWIDDKQITQKHCDSTANDYNYCCGLIIKDGLYYQLLD